MKTLSIAVLILWCLASLLSCLNAKGELHYFDLQKALDNAQVKSILPNNIEFRFGLDSGKDTQIISQNIQITKRHKRAFSNSLSVEYSCQMALAKALAFLANKANALGANKVVNIVGIKKSKGTTKGTKSLFAENVFDSKEKFECLVRKTGSKSRVSLQADFGQADFGRTDFGTQDFVK